MTPRLAALLAALGAGIGLLVAAGSVAKAHPPPPVGSPSAGGVETPVPNAILTQPFGCTAFEFEPVDDRCADAGGHFHSGADLAAPAGTPVLAPLGGRAATGYQPESCGLWVELDHGGDVHTLYCHLASVLVAPGETVGGGEEIGEVGSSGNSTGPHLHFEVHLGRIPVDPIGWLASRGTAT